MKNATSPVLNPSSSSTEHKRDAYGFAVRPQHVQRFREYSSIYKEEEEERSDRWKDFLKRQLEAAQLPEVGWTAEANDTSGKKLGHDDSQKEEAVPTNQTQIWSHIRPSLRAIEDLMNARVRKKINVSNTEKDEEAEEPALFEDAKPAKAGIEEDSEEEFYDLERSESDPTQNVPSSNGDLSAPAAIIESSIPWKEELECLVQGGVPMALRGELWQAFVGVKGRRIENYYQSLLDPDTKNDNSKTSTIDSVCLPEKWKGQIEKDLPRTFPGHPALDDDGRNALRRLLTAYARHNPSVGYCQAMNFFAGLLLLLMPEENAFWALMGILDDYFDGYYSEEMLESQVDQLVFEELVRERFPKLVNHLDYLGVQVAWVSGPWFLSIFMNMLPWESVLRVWDVLLFQGNRVMLFRTALALMELYGPALVTTKDAGDAITLLQSLAGSTFDSSQLVLTACMGYQNVNEPRLQVLRNKHRPAVETALEERSKGLQMLKEKKIVQIGNMTNGVLSRIDSESSNENELYMGISGDVEIDSVPDLQEQISWLKNELCMILDEKQSSTLRAEELETALMEMVKQDNRQQLIAKVEQLEREIAELHQALTCKQEQENAMLQVLMRVEQEQRVTEDARIYAEQDAAAQRYAAHVLQEKYEAATTSLAEMEERLVMAESMLEATLQYQTVQPKAQPSPRSTNHEPSATRTSQEFSQDIPVRKISLLSRPFGLGWLDKNKEKPVEEAHLVKSNDELKILNTLKDTNGHQMEEVSLG
uniref:rab GTPase-activating protein 1-like n=1 Tax=Erigeron canadensis TaxID=72917 RepID=UPI001CB999C6|nr:rab GTPase-activating protein 1-like [Erigeron canadensis]